MALRTDGRDALGFEARRGRAMSEMNETVEAHKARLGALIMRLTDEEQIHADTAARLRAMTSDDSSRAFLQSILRGIARHERAGMHVVRKRSEVRIQIANLE